MPGKDAAMSQSPKTDLEALLTRDLEAWRLAQAAIARAMAAR
jgi:hypothetical protein